MPAIAWPGPSPPGYRRTPVMADDHCLLLAQRPNQSHHVADEMQHRVLVRIGRRVGAAIAAHVEGDGTLACRGQSSDLMRHECHDSGKP